MTPEEKRLLLKDLCARLPYGLKVKCEKYPFPVTVLYAGDVDEVKFKETGGIEHIDLIKPYLRPMSRLDPTSNMTGEEKEYRKQLIKDIKHGGNIDKLEDFYHSHHLDYRGLIEKGLALEEPEGMYKIK